MLKERKKNWKNQITKKRKNIYILELEWILLLLLLLSSMMWHALLLTVHIYFYLYSVNRVLYNFVAISQYNFTVAGR